MDRNRQTVTGINRISVAIMESSSEVCALLDMHSNSSEKYALRYISPPSETKENKI